MNKKNIILAISALFFLLLIFLIRNVKVSPEQLYEDKADSLLHLMTLEEKIGQTNLLTSDWAVTGPSIRSDYVQLIKQGKVGAVFNAYTVDYVARLQKLAIENSRLHIPLLFGYDVIHGHRTIFPIPLAQASSWDLAAIERSDSIAAAEATAEGINWTFAPMVDISRDPRWGRVAEGPGEDTWYACQIAKARVNGFQGTGFEQNNTMLACIKHFAAYGAPFAGRDYNPVEMSERALFEWYLPPYKAGIDAGAGSIMASFNDINGVPSTCNKWLLSDLLRNKWNFNGFVVTDYTGIAELVPHGVATDIGNAAAMAINAGVDMDMQSSAYFNHIAELIRNKKIPEKKLNDAVKRILITKFKLGLFNNPYKYCDKKREKEEIMKPEYITFARQFAAKSCVLLKNKGNTLPLHKNIKSIAVIGPLADSKQDMLGSWSAAGNWEKCVTLLEGIKQKVPSNVKLLHTKGCNVNDNETANIPNAVTLAKQADVIILALGENADMSGEAASRTSISVPGVQIQLAREIIKTGKPCVVVLFNGRPLAIPELDSIAPAILETWFGGSQAGNAIADVLWGDVNPCGKLAMSFPRNEGQIPIFYNSKNTGRPVNEAQPNYKYTSRYIDSPNAPLYPFGYGLSYTSFSYSDIFINQNTLKGDEKITATVEITNTGDYDGEEIVQLYIRDIVGDVSRPVKELKGFRKIKLSKGEKTTVSFTISQKDLAYYHQNMSFTSDPGEFELFIGTNSATTQKATFKLL